MHFALCTRTCVITQARILCSCPLMYAMINPRPYPRAWQLEQLMHAPILAVTKACMCGQNRVRYDQIHKLAVTFKHSIHDLEGHSGPSTIYQP